MEALRQNFIKGSANCMPGIGLMLEDNPRDRTKTLAQNLSSFAPQAARADSTGF
jgi:hypothetical protein